MINVRKGTFEINSSSTHSMVIFDSEDFEKWKSGELFFLYYNNKFVNKDELKEYEKQYAMEVVFNHIGCLGDATQEFVLKCIKESRTEDVVRTVINEIGSKAEGDLPMTFDEFNSFWHSEDSDLKFEEKRFTTKHNDTVIIWGKGGYNG